VTKRSTLKMTSTRVPGSTNMNGKKLVQRRRSVPHGRTIDPAVKERDHVHTLCRSRSFCSIVRKFKRSINHLFSRPSHGHQRNLSSDDDDDDRTVVGAPVGPQVREEAAAVVASARKTAAEIVERGHHRTPSISPKLSPTTSYKADSPSTVKTASTACSLHVYHESLTQHYAEKILSVNPSDIA